MATKPSAERVYEVLMRILERRYEVKIRYELVAACGTKETKTGGEKK